MVKVLDKVKECGLRVIRYGEGGEFSNYITAMKSKKYSSFSSCCLIRETITRLEVITSYYTNENQPKMHPTIRTCSLNEEPTKIIYGQRAFMQFQRVAKVPTLSALGIDLIPKSKETGKYILSAIPMIGSKTDEIRQYSNVYEYDLNSAYSSILLKGVPSFESIEYDRIVKKGEIGFILNEILSLAHEGEHAEIICKVVPPSQSLIRYIMKYYKLKQEGSMAAKAMLNFPIGYYQRTNPLFRAYVVNSCNEYIKKIKTDSCILWNTDAVISTEPLDLEIGDKIGQWKMTVIKHLTQLGNNYQIDHNDPVYRGVPKFWFSAFKRQHGREFDLSKDTLPTRCNKWSFNWNTLSLEVNT